MRLEITRSTDLALKALQVLHAREDGVARMKSRDLARAIGSTPGFTTQVLSPLVQAGWVSTAVGPTGGYALEPSGIRVSLRQLIEQIEGPVADGRCVLEQSACPAPEPCALHDAWVTARTALLASLDDVPAIPLTTAAVATSAGHESLRSNTDLHVNR